MRPDDLVFNYLVNQWLMGERPAGVRHPGLERRRHEPAGRAARAVPRDLPRQHPDAARARSTCSGTPVDLGQDHGADLRHRRDQRPPHAVDGLLPDDGGCCPGRAPSCSATPATSPAWSTRPATRRRPTGRRPSPVDDPEAVARPAPSSAPAAGGRPGPTGCCERSGDERPAPDRARRRRAPAAGGGAGLLRRRPGELTRGQVSRACRAAGRYVPAAGRAARRPPGS